jgi:YidC/Oxa1 family membrane protein insertase
MFANIFQPLIDVAEAILRFYHDTLGVGWGLAIVLLTVTVRLAILPLTFKQVRSMQAMQKLQPQMKELQKRYKDDRQRMNQELMKLYQEHSVNPLGSCLPLLLQLPFFLSLFYLQQSEGFRALVRDTGGSLGVLGGGGNIDAAQAVTGGEKFLFIPDLTVPPTGGVLAALILIYIVTQLGSSTVSAMAMTDKNQKRLMFALPFIFVPFIISFPAGLLVYWITTNTWTIGQQLLIRKVLPPPHLKDEEGHEIDVPDDEEDKPRGLSGMIASIRESAGLSPDDLADGKSGSGGRSGGARGGAKGAKAGAGKGGAKTGAKAGAKGGGTKKSGAKAGAKAGGDGKAGDGKAAATKAGGAAAGEGKAGRARAAGASKGGNAKGGGGKAKSDGARAEGGKAEKASSGDGGNGGPRKAPPPSPRKKKKRSGRRR